ncbi:MAG: alpha-1,2-fucosyltransferase [Saprospiraceae bacterium]
MKEKLIISHIKGGFGNQLHQYGTGLMLAKKLNAKFKVDLSFYEEEKYRNWYKLDKVNVIIDPATPEEIKKLKNEANAPLFNRVLSKLGIYSKFRKKTDIIDGFGFKPDDRLMNLTHSAYISGWCAKEVYVREIKEDLKQYFLPKKPFSPCAENFLNHIQATNSVSIHIRRGDYLELEHFFRVIPVEYYQQAVSEISQKLNKPTFFIFSNDLDWAKTNMDFVKDAIFVDLPACQNYTGLADIEEYQLMKHCRHNIIGNSSFSYWAAYLNIHKGNLVFTPKKWFNDTFYQQSLDKYPICPPDWIQL